LNAAALYDKICVDMSHISLGFSATNQVWV